MSKIFYNTAVFTQIKAALKRLLPKSLRKSDRPQTSESLFIIRYAALKFGKII